MGQRLPITVVLCLFCLGMTGCMLGPQSLRHSRANYNRVIQQTAREEMLLNLVRMRYYQSEEFLRVPSITGQYTYNVALGGTGDWQQAVATKLGLVLGLRAESRPTIVYTPEQDQEFNTRLLAPISLETLELLLSKGWRTDRVLRVAVRNINNIDNATSAGGPTPKLKPEFEEFNYLARLLRQLQQNGHAVEFTHEDRIVDEPAKRSDPIPVDRIHGDDIVLAAEKGYMFRVSPDDQTAMLWTRPGEVRVVVLRFSPEVKDSPEVREITSLLELNPELTAYRIKPDTEGQLMRPRSRVIDMTTGGDREELVVSTRSLKEMMFYLSHTIEVPRAHIKDCLVRQTVDAFGQPFDWKEMTGDLFQVHLKRWRPRNAAVAVQHRGYWFYIDESDLDSKSTFNLLLELFNLEIRAGGGAQTPLLTI